MTLKNFPDILLISGSLQATFQGVIILNRNFRQNINENINTRVSTNITSYQRNAELYNRDVELTRATTRTLMNLTRSENTIVHAQANVTFRHNPASQFTTILRSEQKHFPQYARNRPNPLILNEHR